MTGLRVWRKVEAKSEPQFSRNKHTAAVVGSKLYVFGGYSLQQRQFYNDIMVFDFETKEWKELETQGQCPSKRRAHSCTVMQSGMLVIFGGYNGDYCLNDIYTFDIGSQTWSKRECSGEVPPCRGGHTAVSWDNDCMVVHGGWDVGNVYYDCTYVLRTSDWSWERLKVTGSYKPVGRVGHTSVLHGDDNLIVFGGYGTDGYWDDLNCLNLRTGEWNVIEVAGECRPCQRTFSTMEIVGNHILLFGGSNHDVEMNDVMVFDIGTKTWELVQCPGDIPEGRFAHVSCLYNHKVYLYGGIVRGSGELNGMYELTVERFTVKTDLRNLVKSWIVASGMSFEEYTDSIPQNLVDDLAAYKIEVMEMGELEMASGCQKAVLDTFVPEYDGDGGYEVTGELDEDASMNADEAYFDFECDSNPENWDTAVEDIMQHMLDTNMCIPPLEQDIEHQTGLSMPTSSSSTALCCLSTSASSSSSQLGILQQPHPTLPRSVSFDCLHDMKLEQEHAPPCSWTFEDGEHGVRAEWLAGEHISSAVLDSRWIPGLDAKDTSRSSHTHPTLLPPSLSISSLGGSRPNAHASSSEGHTNLSLSFNLPSGPWTGRCLQPLCPSAQGPDVPYQCFPTSASISAP